MLNLGKKKIRIHTSKVVCEVEGEGLGMCELKKAPQIMQKRPKTYVHDSGP